MFRRWRSPAAGRVVGGGAVCAASGKVRAWRFKTDDSLTLRQPRVGAGDIVTGKLGDPAFRVIKNANGGEVRF